MKIKALLFLVLFVLSVNLYAALPRYCDRHQHGQITVVQDYYGTTAEQTCNSNKSNLNYLKSLCSSNMTYVLDSASCALYPNPGAIDWELSLKCQCGD